MNVDALKTLVAIVETGSLVKASQRLNVTQSTVTARLKTLEEELGQPLIRRQKTGAELTTSGVKFKRYADVMLGLWQQARQEVSLPTGVNSLCNIGCSHDLWHGLGKNLLHLIRLRQPDMAASAWPGDQTELDRWLGTGLVDLAISYQPTTHLNQRIYPLKSERLLLVSNRPNSPARFDPSYVYVEHGENFAQKHAAAYADADTAKLSFGSVVWALDHVLTHQGSAYLPERLVQPYLDQGRLYLVDGAPEFARKVYLIANENVTACWEWLPDLIIELEQS
ncbi:MAG: LysR family transcriptional regulator [Alphaproteobacteria bacterium]